MIATSHVIIGGAAGLAATAILGTDPASPATPAIALGVGIISHFICDSLPHWDHPDAPKISGELVWTRKVWVFAYTDSIIGAILTVYIWGAQFDFNLLSPFLWGAGGGYLPDFVDNVPFWKNQLRRLWAFKRFHRFHEWIHENWNWRFPMPEYWTLGLVTQLAVGIPCLLYILR